MTCFQNITQYLVHSFTSDWFVCTNLHFEILDVFQPTLRYQKMLQQYDLKQRRNMLYVTLRFDYNLILKQLDIPPNLLTLLVLILLFFPSPFVYLINKFVINPSADL